MWPLMVLCMPFTQMCTNLGLWAYFWRHLSRRTKCTSLKCHHQDHNHHQCKLLCYFISSPHIILTSSPLPLQLVLRIWTWCDSCQLRSFKGGLKDTSVTVFCHHCHYHICSLIAHQSITTIPSCHCHSQVTYQRNSLHVRGWKTSSETTLQEKWWVYMFVKNDNFCHQCGCHSWQHRIIWPPSFTDPCNAKWKREMSGITCNGQAGNKRKSTTAHLPFPQ